MSFKVGDKVEVINVDDWLIENHKEVYKQQTTIIDIIEYYTKPEYKNIVTIKLRGRQHYFRLRDKDLRLLNPQLMFDFMY